MTTPSENKRFYPHKISSLIKCHIARKKKKKNETSKLLPVDIIAVHRQHNRMYAESV